MTVSDFWARGRGRARARFRRGGVRGCGFGSGPGAAVPNVGGGALIWWVTGIAKTSVLWYNILG